MPRPGETSGSLGPVLIFGSLLAALSVYWLASINAVVKTPYLDEFFHVQQALRFWNHDWRWDPKITTPPGLYLVSYLGLCIGRVFPAIDAIQQLRSHNVIGILLVFLVANQILRASRQVDVSIAHTAFNICTFPPLFFFSGLYYTDVLSVLVVLAAHKAFHERQPVLVTFYSLLSLWFRQTNIFWTAVYLGGLEVIRQVEARQKDSKALVRNTGWSDIVDKGWNHGVLYDPAVDSAFLEDYLKMGVSLVILVLRNVQSLIVPLMPYLFTIVAFGGFILWNGGVVLGDKDNHIASIHLPQMLYIWPYIAFFSWPVILPSLIKNLTSCLPTRLANSMSLRIPSQHSKIAIRLVVLIPALALTILIIHYNTIIHPFLLADNRHYTFYVFRILRIYPIIRYFLAPAYVFFAWACMGALSTISVSSKQANPSTDTTSSTLFLWLITSTLSLATAPLVEPRYFILPWIVWRTNVAAAKIISAQAAPKSVSKQTSKRPEARLIDVQNIENLASRYSLSLETIWHLIVAGITGWVFLNKGFTWPNEPGEVMRFMW